MEVKCKPGKYWDFEAFSETAIPKQYGIVWMFFPLLAPNLGVQPQSLRARNFWFLTGIILRKRGLSMVGKTIVHLK